MAIYTARVLCQVFINKLSLIERRGLHWYINISVPFNVPRLCRRLNTANINTLHIFYLQKFNFLSAYYSGIL